MTGKREYPLADVLAVLVRWAASVTNLNKNIDKNGFVCYNAKPFYLFNSYSIFQLFLPGVFPFFAYTALQ